MKELLQQILAGLGDPQGLIESVKGFILGKFGTPGLIAAIVLLVSLLGLMVIKAVKLSFDVVRYVAVPSVAVTFIATYFLPYSFVYIFPVTVAFFSIILIIKG